MFVAQEIAQDAYDHGKCIGMSTPCRETKWMWYKVFRMSDNRIIAVVMSEDDSVMCGEVIEEKDLSRYVDVVEK